MALCMPFKAMALLYHLGDSVLNRDLRRVEFSIRESIGDSIKETLLETFWRLSRDSTVCMVG